MISVGDTSVVSIKHYDARSLGAVIPEVARLYEVVYQEPPYYETSEDAADFASGLPRRGEQPAFRLAAASVGDTLIGFAFGHQLAAESKWWQGATTPLPMSITREYAGRTFAIIELAVAAEWRRHGVGKALHDALLADAVEERATLLVRPEATPAQAAYKRWGYSRVGAIRPWPEAPLYDVMVLDLDTSR